MDKTEDSTSHMITYNALKEIIVNIKHDEIKVNSSFKEEEDEPPEDEGTKTYKILILYQTIVEDMNKFMAKNGETYGIE